MAATVEQFNPRAEQQFAALQQANRVRLLRAQLKRDVFAGQSDVTAFILDPPEFANGMEIYDLMIAMPRWGRVRVTKTLQRCQVSPHRPIGALTAGERQRIVQRIGER